MDYNGKYLYIPAKDEKKACFVAYNGGKDTSKWLDFCYDFVAPDSRLIDIVSVQNHRIPRAFNDVDIIVDDMGLFGNGGRSEINPFPSFIYGNLLVGDALLGFVAYDANSEGNHVFPLSEHPHFVYLHQMIAEFLGVPFIPDAPADFRLNRTGETGV